MRNIVIGMLAVSVVAVYAHAGGDEITAEQIVARPPAQVYAELDRLYKAVEERSASSSSVVGTPPVPVTMTFQRDPGRMLGMEAKGGMRSAWIKTWIEPGSSSDETILKVSVWPETMLERTKMGDVHSAVEAVLHQTADQLGPGTKIAALFGGPGRVNRDENWRHVEGTYVASGSTKPMVDPTAAVSRR